MIYLLEKAWSDPMENDSGAALGYAPYAYVEKEIEAKGICDKSKVLDKSFCWACSSENMREMIYRPIPKYGSIKTIDDTIQKMEQSK